MNILEASAEISVAVNFMLSHLYNKLPRRRVDAFAEEVEKGILSKFQGHWYPEKPSKGAAYRCIAVSSEKIDPVILHAARHSGLDVDEVKSCLPEELLLWIDPGEVSYAVGDRGGVKVLYSEYAASQAAASQRPPSSSPCAAAAAAAPPTTKQQTFAMEQSAPSHLQGCLHAAGLTSDPFCGCDAGSALSSSLESLSLSPLPGGGSGGCSSGNSSSSPWASADPWCHPLGLSPWPPSPAASAPATLGGSGSGSLRQHHHQQQQHHHHQPPPTQVLPAPHHHQQPPAPPSVHASQLTSTVLQFGGGVAGRGGGGVVGVAAGGAAGSGGAPPGGANKTFTAAMFAQTKFGSTKLKSKSKNPSRLSPSIDAAAAAAAFASAAAAAAAAAISPMPTAAAAAPVAYLSSHQHQATGLHSAASLLLHPAQQQRRAAGSSAGAAASLYFDSFHDLPFLSVPQQQQHQPSLQHGGGSSAAGLNTLAGARDGEPHAAIAATMVDDASLLALSPTSAADAGRAHSWLDLRGGSSGGSVAYPQPGPFRHVMVA